MTYEQGIAEGMRRAAEIAEGFLAAPRYRAWEYATGVDDVRAAILAAIPTAGAWEPPADRKDGYECLGRCTSSDGAQYWQTIYWQAPTAEEPEGLWNDTWGVEIYPDPTAFAPAPAGEGEG